MAAKKTRRKSPPKKRGPVPRKGLPRWWKAYFAAIAGNGGFKGRAAKACKIARSAPAKYIEDHPELAAAFEEAMADALDEAAENLMAEAVRRGEKGVLEPVFYMGEKVSQIRRYSDTLLMFALNARGRGTRQTTCTLDLSALMEILPDEHLRRIRDGEDPLAVVASAILANSPKKGPENP